MPMTRVTAHVSRDDGLSALVDIDVTAWFESASTEETRKLEAASYRGEIADHVLYHMAAQSESVDHFLRSCTRAREGFECQINSEEAEAWMLKQAAEQCAAVRKTVRRA
jgi:hypothetical protein